MRFLHPIVVVAISIGAAALAAVVGNDYYLRIGFMMCVYYLCVWMAFRIRANLAA